MPSIDPRSQLLKGALPLLILGALADGELYGYEIAQRLGTRTSGVVAPSEGSLYPALHRLEAEGAVTATWRARRRRDRARRYYRLTERGHAAARRAARRLASSSPARSRASPWSRPVGDTADRSTWLARVARALDASPEVEADVLAELAAHLDDEEADGVAHGLDPGRRRDAQSGASATRTRWDTRCAGLAGRRVRRSPWLAEARSPSAATRSSASSSACSRLWPPDACAGSSAAGPGGFVPSSAPGAYAGFAAVAIGLTYAAHVAPSTIVRSSAWSIRSVRRRLAVGAVVVGVPLALLLPGQELDAWLALAYPLAPLAVAAAALRAPAAPTFRPGAVTVAVAVAVLALPLVAWAGDDTVVPPAIVEPANAAVLGRPAAEVPSGMMPTSSSAWATGDGNASTTGIQLRRPERLARPGRRALGARAGSRRRLALRARVLSCACRSPSRARPPR